MNSYPTLRPPLLILVAREKAKEHQAPFGMITPIHEFRTIVEAARDRSNIFILQYHKTRTSYTNSLQHNVQVYPRRRHWMRSRLESERGRVLLQTVNGLPKLAEHNNAAVADVLDVPAVLDVQGPPRQH